MQALNFLVEQDRLFQNTPDWGIDSFRFFWDKYSVLTFQNFAELCAELCCNSGKKGLSGKIGTYSGADRDFYRYLHQNAELLKIRRKHDNPISGGLAMGN